MSTHNICFYAVLVLKLGSSKAILNAWLFSRWIFFGGGGGGGGGGGVSENMFWHFMQIVSLGDSLHEMSKPVFFEK